MSLWKNRPKSSPAHFWRNKWITVSVGKVAKKFGIIPNFLKTAQSKPSRKFAQFGHSGFGSKLVWILEANGVDSLKKRVMDTLNFSADDLL
jgi:hypothetical protein